MAENSTEKNFWNCPACGTPGTLTDVRSIFDDTRFDIFECKCGCAWRHYYKIAQSKCEVVRPPKAEDKVPTEVAHTEGDTVTSEATEA